MFLNVRPNDEVPVVCRLEYSPYKYLDVVPGGVTVKIAQDNTTSLKASTNVLFDSTSDENPERDGGVLFEEVEDVINEFLYTSFVLALVKTVDDGEERSLGEGLPKSASIYDSQERGEDQAIQLYCQRQVVGEQARLLLNGGFDEWSCSG